MKKLAFGLFLFVGLICRSEAQLNGEYSFEISDIFGTSPFCFEDGQDNSDFFSLYPSSSSHDLQFLNSQTSHNPKTGAFTITGQLDFNRYFTSSIPPFDRTNLYVYPEDFNGAFVGDDWDLEPAPTRIIGRTYTDKRTKRSLIDFSSGTITLKGDYLPAGGDSESWIKITKGSLTFRARGLDCDDIYSVSDPLPPVQVTGSVILANRQTKRLNTSQAEITGLDWGGDWYFNVTDDYSAMSGFELNIDVTTSRNTVSGSAKIFYYYLYVSRISDYVYTEIYPDRSTPAKEFVYSVKGTSKNGIATLNLTGLGVIKGLKATIYIDENTQEIIPNGKNSITLYGQTIKY
jgi:hypothetical protein